MKTLISLLSFKNSVLQRINYNGFVFISSLFSYHLAGMSVPSQAIVISQNVLFNYFKGKIFVFLYVTLSNAVATYQHFGGRCYLHFQGKRVFSWW
jgi:hypothetical protein